MDDVLVLNNQFGQFGPLPITVTFNALADRPVSLFLSGAAWTTAANSMLQLAMELDGHLVGSTAPVVFANNADRHLALPAVYVPFNLTAREHTLTLLNSSATVTTDSNDFFHVSLHP